MDQPIPKVSRADVERVVRRDFADGDAGQALSILDEYGLDSEPCRVQLAALKLAAGSISALKREIQTAKCDFRDVLCGAEYPRYSREIAFSDAPESVKRAVIEDDWKQYEAWLKR
jgi:hypothetical protein